MYCRKCGSELPSDGVFCPKCGTEAAGQVISNASIREGDRKKKIIPLLTLIFLLIVGISIVGIHYWNNHRYSQFLAEAEQYILDGDVDNAIAYWEKAIDIRPKDSGEIKEELNYYRSIKDATSAFDSSDWNLAIDYLEFAIELKPEISENYLLLATAYVEKWDLFNAKKALSNGYEATKSPDLKNVSIWGPLSLIETAYYMTEYMPITRCEYLFSDNGVNSYIYAYGDPIAGASYIFKNERVKYITLLDYDEYSYIGMFPQQIQGIPIFDSVLTYFDVEYNSIGQMSAVTYAGTTFATIDYEGDRGATITAKADFRDYFSVGDELKFYYNENNLISEMIYGDISVEFRYDENGGYQAVIPSVGTILKFDSAGLFVGLDEPNGADNFSANSENGRILSYEMDGVKAEIGYEDDKISTFKISRTLDVTIHNSINFFYENINGIDYLVRMEYTLPEGDKAEFLIYWDDNGKVERISNELDGYDMLLSYTNNRLTSYVLMGRDLTSTTYVLEYDVEGRYTGKSIN